MTRKAKPVPMGVGTGSGNKGKAGSAPYSPPKPHRKPPGHGIAIAPIKVGHRHRRDLGDIAALATSMLYVRFLFGVPLNIDDWFAFLVSVPVGIVSIGMLGFMLGAAFVRYRSAGRSGTSSSSPSGRSAGS